MHLLLEHLISLFFFNFRSGHRGISDLKVIDTMVRLLIQISLIKSWI
uniref:Uncharacterized protein n=1 Tax=Lepeophtheirus salmonis TaxID=72036 RepID=A0A0K2UYQ3_LEPSM